MSRRWRLEASQLLDRPRDEVFAFFSDAGNLERITPPWIRFGVVTDSPIEMRVGAVIDYRLRIRGLPLRWRSRIALWEPPERFVDEQVRGPYRFWRHEHLFRAEGTRTRVEDRVEYGVPGGALVHALLVRPDVERIFRFRQQVLGELFGAGPAEVAIRREMGSGLET